MNTEPLSKLLLPDEYAALEELSDGLIADINARLSRIIRKLGLKRVLDLFEVSVVGVQLTMTVDDKTREYLLDRRGEIVDTVDSGDSDIPDYFA